MKNDANCLRLYSFTHIQLIEIQLGNIFPPNLHLRLDFYHDPSLCIQMQRNFLLVDILGDSGNSPMCENPNLKLLVKVRHYAA